MDERKEIEPIKGETAPIAPEATATKAADTPDLPVVEAPSISPAGPVAPEPVAIEPVTAQVAEAAPAIEPTAASTTTEAAPEPVAEPIVTPIAAHPRFAMPRFAMPSLTLRPRHKRYAALAASVVFAAVIGAVAGSIAGSNSVPPPAKPDVAALEENKALQQSVSRLAKEVTTLRANLEASNKAAKMQMAKLNDRLVREAEVTGSISAPATTAPAVEPTHQASAPVPTPRPAPRVAAVEAPPARTPVVAGWSIRDTRGGYVFVEGAGGIFQVIPGAPLPGLGPVESIKRYDGRWVVLTPKGMIVSMRDRQYFE